MTSGPKNTATVAGSSCSLQNLTHVVVQEGSTPPPFQRNDNGESVQWEVAPSYIIFGKLRVITNYDDKVTSEFTTTYTVSGSQMTVFSATVGPQGSSPYSTAGLYTLMTHDPNCITAANLIVIRGGATCSYNTSNPSKPFISCSAVFAEAVTQPCNPVFTWKNSAGVQVYQQRPNPIQIDSFVKRSQSQLFVDPSDTQIYKCQLTFSVPNPGPFNYIAPNAPVFSDSCSDSIT